jgi:hypothetical protein
MKDLLVTRSKLAIGGTLFASLLIGTSLPAQAGSLFLTGHDIDNHFNADGYDVTILKYLTGKTDLSSVKVSYLGSSGYATPTQGAVTSYTVSTMTDAQWATALQADVLEIGSGNRAISVADVAKITTRKSQIVNFFNAGGNIWGNTSDSILGYYDAFLPPALISTTAPQSASDGFYATTAGTGIGITNIQVNGDPTHNSFTNIPSAFTVFEKLSLSGNPAVQSINDPIISIGLKDGTITNGGGTGGGVIITPPTAAPEPFTIVGTLLGGAAAFRMKKRLKVTNKL